MRQILESALDDLIQISRATYASAHAARDLSDIKRWYLAEVDRIRARFLAQVQALEEDASLARLDEIQNSVLDVLQEMARIECDTIDEISRMQARRFSRIRNLLAGPF